VCDLLLEEDGEPVAEMLGAVLSPPGGPEGGPHFVHRIDWLRRALPPGPQTGQRHVLLAGTSPGAGGTGPVRLSLAPDGQALHEALADTSVTDVAWFWQPAPGQMSYARLRAELEHNFRALLEALAAPGLADPRRTPRVWLVTERAQWLPGDRADGQEQIAAGALWGFGHVLLNEHPRLKATCVDVDGDGGAGAMCAGCWPQTPPRPGPAASRCTPPPAPRPRRWPPVSGPPRARRCGCGWRPRP
jgi:hypothetical protein